MMIYHFDNFILVTKEIEMPNNIGFFTAVKYELEVKSLNQSLLEKVDNYFYLGGKKAHVIQGKTKNGHEKILLAETNSSLLARIGKVVSYLTIILPLVFLIAKAILRATHTFRLIDPKKKLEKGINITETLISKIESLKSKILSGKKDDEIEWLSKGNNFVFKLKENPSLVFKTPRGMSAKQRFQNMIKAKEVCLLHRLGLLVIPNAKEFFIDGHSFIAEKSLDFNPKEGGQENLYQLYSKQLSEAVHQLAIFIAKTGFNDVTWRNIPVLSENPEYLGPRRIGLIDIEHFEDKVNGFTGDANGSPGLLGCVTKEQIDTIVSEARKQNVRLSDQDIQHVKNKRLHDFQSDQELNQFYQKHGIKIGDEPIQVDENSIDFSDYPQSAELKTLAIDLIKEINAKTEKSSPEDSIKGRRYIYINPNPPDSPFYRMNSRLVDKNKKSTYATDEEFENATYLGCVVKKLIDLGLIYKIVKRNGHGYFLQA